MFSCKIVSDSRRLQNACNCSNQIPVPFSQHSSLELQQKYLPKFIKAAEEGKIKGELIAMMQDRICCTLGKPQVYGTQGNYDDNGVFVPAAIEDSVNVDVRRASMGMMPLSDYIKEMSRK